MRLNRATLVLLLLGGPVGCVGHPASEDNGAARRAGPPHAAEGVETVKQDADPAAAETASSTLERSAATAAEKLFQRFVSLVHYPATQGWSSVSAKGGADPFGNTWGFKWTPETGFGVEVAMSEAGRSRFAETESDPSNENLAMMVKVLLESRCATVPFDLPAGWKNREHFHVTTHQDGDDRVVEMTAVDDETDAKSRRYVFGKDGLLRSSSIEWKPSPSWPEGLRGELEWRFQKQGQRFVIASISLSYPALDQGVETKFSYYEGPNGGALLREIAITDSHLGNPVLRFHDYVVDGQLVETTTAPPDGEGK